MYKSWKLKIVIKAYLNLIILGLSISLSAVAADEVYNKSSWGGWANYTYVSDKTYLLDSHPQVGMYAAYKALPKLNLAGLVYYDPIYKKGRVGYLYAKTYAHINKTDSLTLSLGMLRSDWGIWSDYMVNPTTSPLILQSNSLYTLRYESDIVHRLGINTELHKEDFTVRFFAGANYALDEEQFAKFTYVQNEPMDKSFGSLIYSTLEYRPAPGHLFKTGLSVGKLSDTIDNDLDRLQVGYKFENDRYTFSIEGQQLNAHGKVDRFRFDEKAVFRDMFMYAAYDFDKFRLYSVVTSTYKNSEMAQYVKFASAINSINSGSTTPPDLQKVGLLNSGTHRSQGITLGINYDIQKNLRFRIETTYTHLQGLERMLNSKNGVVRDENVAYIGLSLTQTF